MNRNFKTGNLRLIVLLTWASKVFLLTGEFKNKVLCYKKKNLKTYFQISHTLQNQASAGHHISDTWVLQVVPLDYDIVVSNASLGRYLHFVVAKQRLLPPIDIRELQRRQSFLLIILQIIISKIKGNFGGGGLWCLMPHS